MIEVPFIIHPKKAFGFFVAAARAPSSLRVGWGRAGFTGGASCAGHGGVLLRRGGPGRLALEADSERAGVIDEEAEG